jgi:hypothetical protein
LKPLQTKKLLEEGQNELELTRDSFIKKTSCLSVSYFCYSTEIRFILQAKENPTFDPAQKLKESEVWHAKALEIACTFLPGECPLLTHINFSYRKHFVLLASKNGNQYADDVKLTEIQPLQGIEQSVAGQIARRVHDIELSITPSKYKSIY